MKEALKANKRRYGLMRSKKKSVQEFVDFDYADKLSVGDRDWLARFSAEYYKNSFSNDDDDLHNTPTLRRKCYTNENSRNRDMWNKFMRLNDNSGNAMKTEDEDDTDT